MSNGNMAIVIPSFGCPLSFPENFFVISMKHVTKIIEAGDHQILKRKPKYGTW